MLSVAATVVAHPGDLGGHSADITLVGREHYPHPEHAQSYLEAACLASDDHALFWDIYQASLSEVLGAAGAARARDRWSERWSSHHHEFRFTREGFALVLVGCRDIEAFDDVLREAERSLRIDLRLAFPDRTRTWNLIFDSRERSHRLVSGLPPISSPDLTLLILDHVPTTFGHDDALQIIIQYDEAAAAIAERRQALIDEFERRADDLRHRADIDGLLSICRDMALNSGQWRRRIQDDLQRLVQTGAVESDAADAMAASMYPRDAPLLWSGQLRARLASPGQDLEVRDRLAAAVLRIEGEARERWATLRAAFDAAYKRDALIEYARRRATQLLDLSLPLPQFALDFERERRVPFRLSDELQAEVAELLPAAPGQSGRVIPGDLAAVAKPGELVAVDAVPVGDAYSKVRTTVAGYSDSVDELFARSRADGGAVATWFGHFMRNRAMAERDVERVVMSLPDSPTRTALIAQWREARIGRALALAREVFDMHDTWSLPDAARHAGAGSPTSEALLEEWRSRMDMLAIRFEEATIEEWPFLERAGDQSQPIDIPSVRASFARWHSAARLLMETNRSYLERAAAELGPELGGLLASRAYEAAYPAVFVPSSADLLIGELATTPSVSDDTRALISALQVEYHSNQERSRVEIIDALREWSTTENAIRLFDDAVASGGWRGWRHARAADHPALPQWRGDSELSAAACARIVRLFTVEERKAMSPRIRVLMDLGTRDDSGN